MSTPPPRRRRRRPQRSLEETDQVPRPRKKKSSGKKKKKSKNNVVLLRAALFAAAAITLAVGIFMFDWKEIGGALGFAGPHEKLAKRMLSIQTEQADILASIKDKASAEAASPRLIKVFEDVAKITFEVKDLRKTQKITPEEDRALKEKYEERQKALAARIKEEIQRISKNPALASHMSDIFRDARFAGMEVTNQLRIKRAKGGANAAGYLPVTASTNLTNGMKIQVLALGDIWRDGTVTDVSENGTVKVNFDIHRNTDAFDQYHKRDKLRIPNN